MMSDVRCMMSDVRGLMSDVTPLPFGRGWGWVRWMKTAEIYVSAVLF